MTVGRMLRLGAIALGLGAATFVVASRRVIQPDEQSTPANMDIGVEWSMQPLDGGTRLHIEYKVTNKSDERLYLADQLLTTENNKLVRAADRMIVMNGKKDGQVLFSRGRVDEHVPSSFPMNPGARAFDPGTSLHGNATLDLPLKAWHNYGFAQPLKGTPKTAILQLSYLKGESKWVEVRAEDGSTVLQPQPPARLLNAEGNEQEIPRR